MHELRYGIVCASRHVLRRLTALELTTVLNLNPLVTAVLAWIILGNRLSALQLGAMLLVVASVLVMQLARVRRDNGPGPVPDEEPRRRAY